MPTGEVAFLINCCRELCRMIFAWHGEERTEPDDICARVVSVSANTQFIVFFPFLRIFLESLFLQRMSHSITFRVHTRNASILCSWKNKQFSNSEKSISYVFVC